MAELTVVILTFNEERHLSRAIDSVAAIASKVIVVDSYSTDRTAEIAAEKGALFVQNRFVSQAQQFQWALEHCAITTPWILRLDADEVIGAKLADEIARRLGSLPADVVGIHLRRRHLWMGRWLMHGGRYPVVILRIWRTGKGRVEDRWMDEHVIVHGGKTITFQEEFSDENLNDIGYFVDKHNKYATREAIEILDRRLDLRSRGASEAGKRASPQGNAKDWLKRHFYDPLPFTVTAPTYFLWRYIVELGFLDGRTGLVYHFLQGYWYRFLVGAKVLEFERAIAHLSDKRAIAAELSRLTGYRLLDDPVIPRTGDENRG